MNRLICMAALALGSTLATASHAQGQSNLNGGFGGVDLLLNLRVQEELKLDAEQITKARNLSDSLMDRQKVTFGMLVGLSGEARTRKAHELAVEHAEAGMKAVEAILRPDQYSRFRQVDLQQRGASALLEPSLSKTLGISAKQVDQIQPILNHSILSMREALATTRGDRRTSAEKVQAIRRETNEKALSVLTEAQKTAWNRMTGSPLDLASASRLAR
jgi:DNA polymerase III alpha subunit